MTTEDRRIEYWRTFDLSDQALMNLAYRWARFDRGLEIDKMELSAYEADVEIEQSTPEQRRKALKTDIRMGYSHLSARMRIASRLNAVLFTVPNSFRMDELQRQYGTYRQMQSNTLFRGMMLLLAMCLCFIYVSFEQRLGVPVLWAGLDVAMMVLGGVFGILEIWTLYRGSTRSIDDFVDLSRADALQQILADDHHHAVVEGRTRGITMDRLLEEAGLQGFPHPGGYWEQGDA